MAAIRARSRRSCRTFKVNRIRGTASMRRGRMTMILISLLRFGFPSPPLLPVCSAIIADLFQPVVRLFPHHRTRVIPALLQQRDGLQIPEVLCKPAQHVYHRIELFSTSTFCFRCPALIRRSASERGNPNSPLLAKVQEGKKGGIVSV